MLYHQKIGAHRIYHMIVDSQFVSPYAKTSFIHNEQFSMHCENFISFTNIQNYTKKLLLHEQPCLILFGLGTNVSSQAIFVLFCIFF